VVKSERQSALVVPPSPEGYSSHRYIQHGWGEMGFGHPSLFAKGSHMDIQEVQQATMHLNFKTFVCPYASVPSFFLTMTCMLTARANGKHCKPVEPVDGSNVAKQDAVILLVDLALGLRSYHLHVFLATHIGIFDI